MTIKLRSLLEENNILVPRNIDSRIENKKRIDHQRIQEYIKKGSKGDLDLKGTPLTKLPDNLTKVDGTLFIFNSSIEDLNNLEYVRGNLWANDIEIKSLPENLTKIGGTLSVGNCPIDNIDNVKYIGGGLWVYGTQITRLPEGLILKGNLYYDNTPLAKRFPVNHRLENILKKETLRVEEI